MAVNPNLVSSVSKTVTSAAKAVSAAPQVAQTVNRVAATVQPQSSLPMPQLPQAPQKQQQQTTDPNAALNAYLDAQKEQQRQSAISWLAQTLTSFGLSGMAGAIDSLVQEWGTNTDVISLKLKDTSQYKERFAGLLALQQKGVTDVANEAQYIQLESQYRQAFRENGLQNFLGDAGSSTERSKIADIVSKFSLSVNEVRDRISDAQRVAANTPQEVKDAFARYYGVDSSQLVQYALDPQRTADIINRQANAAMAGGIAAQSHLGIGSTTAELVAGQAGTGDIQVGQLRNQFVDAAQVRDATKRLAAIENTDLTDDESVQASLALDAEAQKKVTGLQSRERARFGGSSATVKGTLSRNLGA